MLPVQTNMMCIPNPLKTSSTNGFPRCKALRCSAARSHNLLFYREVCHLRKIAPRTSQHPPSARRFSVLRGWRGGRGGRSRGVKPPSSLLQRLICSHQARKYRIPQAKGQRSSHVSASSLQKSSNPKRLYTHWHHEANPKTA